MDNKLNMLLIEDDLLDVKIFQRTIRDEGDSFNLIVANTLEKSRIILEKQSVDLIFVDPGLPDSSGVETIEQVLRQSPDKPVIILTGSDDEKLPIQAIELGAHDYLIKDTIDKQSLKRSMRYALEKNMIMNELKQKSKQLELSEIRFHHLIENNSDSTLIINKDGVVKYVNKAAENQFGRSQESFVGRVFDYPIQKEGMSEITINVNGKSKLQEIEVLQTEWLGEKAYLVSLRQN